MEPYHRFVNSTGLDPHRYQRSEAVAGFAANKKGSHWPSKWLLLQREDQDMRCMWILRSVLVALALLIAPNPGRTNTAPLQMWGGGATLTSPHQYIRMDSQEVSIRLKKTKYEVDVVFHFFNTGESTTEWVGFPKRGGYSQFVRFDMWVDGTKVAVSEERDLSPNSRFRPGDRGNRDRWLVHHVAFPRHGETTIRVSYEIDYMDTGGTPNVVRYEYGTGSYWKDAIGLAVFTIDGTEIGGAKRFSVGALHPSARKLITENAVRYAIRNFKPSPDGQFEVVIRDTSTRERP